MTVAEESDPNTEEGETAAAEEEDNEPQETQTEVMEVTPLHPIYVEGEGWLNAENLEAGDRLRLADGGMAKVLAIEHQQLSTPVVVYNFTVATFHTYFVLDLQVLVHNVEHCNPTLGEIVKAQKDHLNTHATPYGLNEKYERIEQSWHDENVSQKGSCFDVADALCKGADENAAKENNLYPEGYTSVPMGQVGNDDIFVDDTPVGGHHFVFVFRHEGEIYVSDPTADRLFAIPLEEYKEKLGDSVEFFPDNDELAERLNNRMRATRNDV